MDPVVDIYVHEDDSVRKKLTDRAIKLQKKYYKKRKINEKVLKKKTPLQKAVSAVFDIIGVCVALVCGAMCFSGITNRFQNLPASLAGYTTMKIASGSMVASGFEIGESVTVSSVDAKTLKEGDIIAFYVFRPNSIKFRQLNTRKVDTSKIGDVKFDSSMESFFGFHNEEIKTAAASGSNRVIHEIIAVYEDQYGQRWFETKGTSNPLKDSWYINENYIIGAYNNSPVANFMASIIGTMTSSMGTVILLTIPLVIIAIFIVGLCMKDVQIAMLESDVVEEKRKLTDEICVKNKIGYQMSNKVKYKVLAQATENEKLKYIELLWKDGNTPNAMKKYYLRKQLLVKPMEEMNRVNRRCEKMFEEGENPRVIAKFYEDEKKRINDKYEEKRKQIKTIRTAREEERKELENSKNKKKSRA